MQPMPNIRGAAPNTMGNTIPNSMPNSINPMNSNNVNMNMGLYTEIVLYDILINIRMINRL